MWNVFTKADIKLKFCLHSFTIEYSLLINYFLVWKNMNNNKDTTSTSNGHYSSVFSVDFEQVFTRRKFLNWKKKDYFVKFLLILLLLLLLFAFSPTRKISEQRHFQSWNQETKLSVTIHIIFWCWIKWDLLF